MDSVHDLGGMDGFGPIDHEPTEPSFHADWEGTVFAMALGTMAQGHFTMDAFRHAIERMDPVWYLDSSYYEHWLAAVETLLVEEGVLKSDALTARAAAFAAGKATIPTRADEEFTSFMRALIDTGGDTERDPQDPEFDVGDVVQVRNIHPEGHTRCPEYVRCARGTIVAHHGSHVLPDANAHGMGERPEPLYSVQFPGETLWGPDGEPDTSVTVDLWESYLERDNR